MASLAWLGLTVATGLVFAATVLAAFAGGRLGAGLGVTVGPDMEKLRAIIGDGSPGVGRLLSSMVGSCAKWSKDNAEAILRVERRRFRAMVLLASGALIALLTVALITGGELLA